MLTINRSTLCPRATDHIVDRAGPHAAPVDPLPGAPSLDPPSAFIQARPHSTDGGASEYQKTIAARQVPGLRDSIR